MKKTALHRSVAAGLALLFGADLQAQGNSDAGDPGAGLRSIEEIVVTARRREESAQMTPVSVSVLDGEMLFKANIQEVSDLTSSIPGVNFSASGGSNNTVFSIRGMSRAVFGAVQPAVATYINEVPMSSWGASVPTYDMASVQVLKGPQGTMFGRNTTAGAVLIGTQLPKHELSGYALGTIGNYNLRRYEGAINIPLIEDKVALRVAGQIEKRDGYTKNMSHRGDDDFDNRDRDNIRVSLLLDPFENFSNTSIYERNNIDEQMGSNIFYKYTPGGAVDFVPYYNGSVRTFDPITFEPIPCNGDPACDVRVISERQRQAGPRKAWSSAPTFHKSELNAFTNITSWDLGPVTLKNIFGYRSATIDNVTDIDGTELPMIDSHSLVDTRQYSNEFQVAGEALGGSLEYLAGLFYVKQEPNGKNRLTSQLFAVTGTPFGSQYPEPFNGAIGSGDYYEDESKAVFGQVSYDLGHLNDKLSAFTVDLGIRHTKDKTQLCAVPGMPDSLPPLSLSGCESLASAGRAKADFSKTTYNLGINWAPTDDLLLYAVTRTGYRAGGLNSPQFGGLLTPFQSWDPETVQDFELGLKSDWQIAGIGGRFNLALFHSEYEDLQSAVQVQGAIDGDPDGDGDPSNDPSGQTFFTNVGEATVQGVEAELILQLTNNLELNLSGAWLDKKLDKLSLSTPLPPTLPESAISKDGIEKNAFLAAPDYSYTAGITYHLPLADSLGDFRFSARYFRISDVQYISINAPSYELTDFRLDWSNAMQSNFDLALFVTNAFDKDAVAGPANSSDGVGMSSVLYNQPRMAGLTVRYQFGN